MSVSKDSLGPCGLLWYVTAAFPCKPCSSPMLPRLFYAFGVYGTLDTRELVKLCVLEARHQTGFICNNGRTWPDYAAMMLLLPRCHAAKRMMPMLVVPPNQKHSRLQEPGTAVCFDLTLSRPAVLQGWPWFDSPRCEGVDPGLRHRRDRGGLAI